MNENIKVKEKKFPGAKSLKLNKANIVDIARATLIAVIISLISVLIFGIVIKLTDVPDGIILPINQVIKVISVLLGCIIGFKQKEKGALKGAVVGTLYTALSVLIFWIICGSPKGSFSWADALTGVISGVIAGIIAVNVGKKQ